MTVTELKAALVALHLTPTEAEDYLGVVHGSVMRWLTELAPVPPRVAHLLEAWVQHPPSRFSFVHRHEDIVP